MKYKGNKGVADALKVIHRDFDNETSPGTKDVVNILVARYGLDRALAVKEVMYPIKSLKG